MPKPLAHRHTSTSKTRASLPGWNLQSRATLIVLMVLLPLIGVVLYVGPAWPQVCSRIFVDGGVAIFLWLTSAVGLGVFVMKTFGLLNNEINGPLRFVTAAATGLGIMSLAGLALGLAGALNSPSAWLLIGAGLILGMISLWPSRSVSRQGTVLVWLVKPASWHWLWLLAAPFLALAITSTMVPPGMLWTPNEPHGYDVVEYHLQIPREWYEAHRIIPLHHNVFSFVPFNVEIHYLLAMHLLQGPWAGMYLAQIMHVIFVALTLMAVYGIARRFANPASAILATLSLLTVPWMTQLAPIAYDEGGFLLFGTLAVGWAMWAIHDPANRLRHFALAGAMAGFAAGSKLTAVPEVLLAVPIACGATLLWHQFKLHETLGFKPWLRIGIFGLTAVLCFSPWLIRNVAWTGNPLFPEAMSILGKGDFTPAQVERWDLSLKPPPAEQPAGARLERLGREVVGGWQFGYLLLPLGLFASFKSMRTPGVSYLVLLLLGLTVFWLFFTHLQARFFILAAPLAALLVAYIDWKRAVLVGATLIAIFAAIGWYQINDALITLLYGSAETNRPGIILPSGSGQILTSEDLSFMTPAALDNKDLPAHALLFLAGDARAFYYQIPMSRLRYRTVFDVKDDSPDLVDAWCGPEANGLSSEVLVDPLELARFSKTYVNLPPLSKNVMSQRTPYLVTKH